MKVAIVGFGRMGREIYSVLSARKDEIVAIIDPVSKDERVTAASLSIESLNDADVAIDFSTPSAAKDNIIFYAKTGVRAVIGTTGWLGELESLKALTENDNFAIIYSGNFSLGVAITDRVVRYASSLFARAEDYDVAILEAHHTAKADSPSGTALMLASSVMKGMDSKKRLLVGNSEGRISPDELQISSIRVGSEVGEHEVIFDSQADTVTISHRARSRSGFATGAVKAASWLLQTDKSGFLTLDDYLSELFGGQDA